MRLLRIGVASLVILRVFSWERIPQAEPHPSVIQVRSPHFLFRFHEQDRFYMDRIMARAKGLYEKITLDIGFAPEDPIGVTMAFSEEEFNQFQQPSRNLFRCIIRVSKENQN